MILVRSLAFTDLLSLELMKSSMISNVCPGAVCDLSYSERKCKKTNVSLPSKTMKFRPPHVLELLNGFYLLTNCDLQAIPEDEEVIIPIISQLYCRS